ncbi:MAG: hypothetical protein IKE65_07940 [Clostridia bacterium]|nr:hypothetical protein [Clostridia bacterium]
MDTKKKKLLIIILIVCLVLAAAGITTAVLLHKKSASTAEDKIPASVSADAGTEDAQSAAEEVPGEKYVKKELRKEYRTVNSSGIKGEPDAKIKAYFYNLTKAASPDLQLANFDLLKTYEGFRFYDTTGTTEADGTKSFLLVVYVENGKAVIAHYEEYANTDERADILTEYIKQLDSDYERYAKFAKSIEGDHVLYE